MDFKKKSYDYALSAVVIFIVACAVYFNTLSNGFVWDAVPEVRDNTFIRDLKNLPMAFTLNFHGMYRPLELVTYFFDYRVGGINPWGYHLVNVILHGINCLLVFIFFALLMRRRSAFLGAVLYALTPIHAESVAWIAARDDVLMSIFFLSAVICFINYSRQGKNPVAAMIFFIFALLSKETAIIFPLMITAYTLVFTQNKDRIAELKQSILIVFLLSGIYALVRVNLLHISAAQGGFPGIEKYLKTILAMPAVVIYYLKILFLPVNLCPSYGFEHFAALPAVVHLLSWLALSGFIGLSFRLRRKYPELFFGNLFFFIALLPSLNIIPKCQPIAERYLYLPSAGFFMAIALLVESAYRRFKDERLRRRFNAGFMFALIIIAGLYSLAAFRQNKIWVSNNILWEYTAKHKLADLRAVYNQANELYNSGNFVEAVIKYNQVLKLKPNAEVLNNLGMAYENVGQEEKAKDCYVQALKLDCKLAQAHNNLGTFYYKQGEPEKALFEYREAVKYDSGFAQAYNNIGLIYAQKGVYPAAEFMYRKALAIKPDYDNAKINLKNLHEYLKGRNFDK